MPRLNQFLLCVSFVCVAVGGTLAATKVSCKDEQGRDVDWFYMYKLPQYYENTPTESAPTGLRYIYITSLNYDDWQYSSNTINATGSLTAQTLNPLAADSKILLLAYNDEFPNGTTVMTGGHTKGVVATDGSTGIWLIHSVPKFPSFPSYQYPTSGTRYGQSLLCITLKSEEIHKVGQQLIYNEPNIYYTRLPPQLTGKYPNLEQTIEGKWRQQAPFNNLINLESLAGKQFKSFAKGVHFERELYEDWVAPTLDVNLLVETWRNGAGNLASNCTRSESVYNIAAIEDKDLRLSFKSTHDHSKWAVSEAGGIKLWRWRIGGADWICVGDINRQEHQRCRGGGTVCQKNSKVVQLYRKLVHRFDPCAGA